MSWANEVRKLFGRAPIPDAPKPCAHLYDRVIEKHDVTRGSSKIGWIVVKECCKCGAVKAFELTLGA